MIEFTASRITAKYLPNGATVFTLPMHHRDLDDYRDMVKHAARFTGATVTEAWFTFPECLQMVVTGGAVHTLPLNGETVGIGNPPARPEWHPSYGTTPPARPEDRGCGCDGRGD
jgi:hypothetical protein